MSTLAAVPRSVDRDSPIPAYHQLARVLRNRIDHGDWGVGTQLPTEIQLSVEYAVSRSTVRQALTQLARDRYVTREQGKGTFALEPPRLIMNDLSVPLGLASRSKNQGFNLTTDVLDLQRADRLPSDAGEALAARGPFVELSRRVGFDGAPAAHVLSWLPLEVVPRILTEGLNGGSVSKTLTETYGQTLGRYDNQLQVVGATAEQADLLDVNLDDPLILLSALCTASDESPLEYSQTFWRADRVRLRFEVEVDGLRGAAL